MNNPNEWVNSPPTAWGTQPTQEPVVDVLIATQGNNLDAMNQDEVLLEWKRLKEQLALAKEAEMEMRKYVVSRAFPNASEGTNTLDLGNGYALKAGVKYNYKLASDNDEIEKALDEIATIGNEGKFIAERLVSWTPNFLVSEYRTLQEEKDKGNPTAQAILNVVQRILTITDAAPTLDIKEPKKKK